MKISILMPTYRRPHQFKEALESLALQNRSLIGEIVIGDDTPAAGRAENLAVIEASGLSPLVRYLAHDPPKGNYPNQLSLGQRAVHEYVLLLHDDDHLCEHALDRLAAACQAETNPAVKIWFGRNLVMDEDGRIDEERSRADTKTYGKDGPSAVRPVWEWCLRHSLPPNSWLMRADTYREFMWGPRDGNVGDWGMAVRMANSGALGSFIAEDISKYRVQAASVTGSGTNLHYMYEIAHQLKVPPEREAEKKELLLFFAEVATMRYLRAGERGLAWKCFLSPDWRWQRRFSPRGIVTLAMLATPVVLWRWKLR